MTYCGYFSDIQHERHRNKRLSTYRRPKWSEYYEDNILQPQIENYTCSTRLWLSCFICDNKHTFAKQMWPDLAMLLAFLLETVDWLDNQPRPVSVRLSRPLGNRAKYSFYFGPPHSTIYPRRTKIKRMLSSIAKRPRTPRWGHWPWYNRPHWLGVKK